jgi:hypothetical protein
MNKIQPAAMRERRKRDSSERERDWLFVHMQHY